MQRFLSIGVSTLVALMAAHRAAAERRDEAAVLEQEEITQICACLSSMETTHKKRTRDGATSLDAKSKSSR